MQIGGRLDAPGGGVGDLQDAVVLHGAGDGQQVGGAVGGRDEVRDAGDSADHDADSVAEAGGDGRDDGEVAVAAGELGEAPAVGNGSSTSVIISASSRSVWSVPTKRSAAPTRAGRTRPGDVDGAVAREQDRRQFG